MFQEEHRTNVTALLSMLNAIPDKPLQLPQEVLDYNHKATNGDAILPVIDPFSESSDAPLGSGLAASGLGFT